MSGRQHGLMASILSWLEMLLLLRVSMCSSWLMLCYDMCYLSSLAKKRDGNWHAHSTINQTNNPVAHSSSFSQTHIKLYDWANSFHLCPVKFSAFNFLKAKNKGCIKWQTDSQSKHNSHFTYNYLFEPMRISLWVRHDRNRNQPTHKEVD